jgi:hypothetical protein
MNKTSPLELCLGCFCVLGCDLYRGIRAADSLGYLDLAEVTVIFTGGAIRPRRDLYRDARSVGSL